MRRGTSILTATAALVALAAVLAACAEPPRPQPSATALPGGIEASIVQLRSDVADRQAQVRIHNSDDKPLTIGTVRVDDPRFEGHAVRTIRRQTTIAPGGTVDIRIQLPPMNCAAEAGDGSTPTPLPTEPRAALTPAATPEPDGSASPTPMATTDPGGLPQATTTRATVSYQFGASIAIAVAELSEPIPFLASMYAGECLGERVADVASVTLGAFTPSPAGQPADLALEISPTGREGTATVAGIHQTNLLSFGGAGNQPAVYPIGASAQAGMPAQTVHLPLVPARCDAHVVMEDKRGTVFNVDVTLDGEPGVIELAATPTQRGEILTWVSQWCGIG